jgi:hypothetical protein
MGFIENATAGALNIVFGSNTTTSIRSSTWRKIVTALVGYQPPFDQLPWKDEVNNAMKPSAR